MKNLLTKIGCVLLAIGSFAPVASAEYLSIKEIDKRQLIENSTLHFQSETCGKVFILNDSFENNEINPYFANGGLKIAKFKRKLRSDGEFTMFRKVFQGSSFRTPEAMVFIRPPKHMNKNELKRYMKVLLLEKLRVKFHKDFTEETSGFRSLHWQGMDSRLDSLEKDLFGNSKNLNKNVTSQLRLLTSYFPENTKRLYEEETEELRPLMCFFQLPEHRIKMVARAGSLLVIPALGLGITASVLWSGGLLLPPLFVLSALSATTLGIKDMAMSVRNLWYTEKISINAMRMKKVHKELRKSLSSLEKLADEGKITAEQGENLKKIRAIEKLISKEREEVLDEASWQRFWNRITFVGGLLNAGFNSVNIGGDPTILAGFFSTLFTTLGIIL